MDAAFSDGGTTSARPWLLLGRLAEASREAARRRRAALGGARIFAQTALAVLDRTEMRREGLVLASLFTLGAANELVQTAGLDARSACQIELEMLRRLHDRGLLRTLAIRQTLRRRMRAAGTERVLAAGAEALGGWLRGEDPAPRLESLLRRELAVCAAAPQVAAAAS